MNDLLKVTGKWYYFAYDLTKMDMCEYYETLQNGTIVCSVKSANGSNYITRFSDINSMFLIFPPENINEYTIRTYNK